MRDVTPLQVVQFLAQLLLDLRFAGEEVAEALELGVVGCRTGLLLGGRRWH
jgi:hypothetical protein